MSGKISPKGLRRAPATDPIISRPKEQAAEVEVEKTRMAFTLTVDEASRARAAFINLPASVRPRSFSEFVSAALMARVREVEAEHNDGQKYAGIEPGTIPTGRPLGS